MAFVLIFGFLTLELILSFVKVLVFYNRVTISNQPKWKKMVYLDLDLLLFIFTGYYLTKVNVYCGFWDVFILPICALVGGLIYLIVSNNVKLISFIKKVLSKHKESVPEEVEQKSQWMNNEQSEYSRYAIILFCFFGIVLSIAAGTLLIFTVKHPTNLNQVLQFLIIDNTATDPLLLNYRGILKAIDEFTITIAILGCVSTITQLIFIHRQTEVNKNCRKLIRLRNRLNDIGSEM